MQKGIKILIITGLVAGGAVASYFILMKLSKEPKITVTGIDPNKKSATITIGNKSFPYVFIKGFKELGKIDSFYTAQVVAYDNSSQGEADYIDVKLMKSGKMVNSKRVYLG